MHLALLSRLCFPENSHSPRFVFPQNHLPLSAFPKYQVGPTQLSRFASVPDTVRTSSFLQAVVGIGVESGRA
jgi:hypothetical protein